MTTSPGPYWIAGRLAVPVAVQLTPSLLLAALKAWFWSA
jgi:hypothetical protein